MQLGFSKNSLNMNCGSSMSKIPAPHKYGVARGSLFYHASNNTARLSENTEVARDNAGFRTFLVAFKLVTFKEETLEIRIMFWGLISGMIFSGGTIGLDEEKSKKLCC
jgi:hypothetical protein